MNNLTWWKPDGSWGVHGVEMWKLPPSAYGALHKLKEMERAAEEAACSSSPAKAYIAGKITGDPDYRSKFHIAQKMLESEGYTVINPAVLPEGLAPADYMRICFAMMDSADVVAFLPDYEDSCGARLEWAWCEYVGKRVMYLGREELR